MERNRIFDIMINLLEGIKNQNRLIERNKDKEMALNGCAYLLNQTIRQYQVPQSHYFVSKKAQELWNQISTDSIFNYTYQDKVTKNIDGTVIIEKFRGGEGTPYATTTISRKDKFTYKDVFTDEHIVTVSNIIEELLALPKYDYASIERILNKIYICKMLKREDRSIASKRDRSTDYREVIVFDYKDAGIFLTTFDYKANLEQLILEKEEELTELELEEELLNGNEDIDNVEEKTTMEKSMGKEKDFLFEVVHDQKGDGKAIGFVNKNGDRYLRIDFGNAVEEFVYPDQFMCHLKAKDSDIQSKIKKEFAMSRSQSIPKSERFSLTAGYYAGTNAQDIYNKYCRIFDWNVELQGHFAKQQKLYAKNVTPEGYSVWMIVHTNLCEMYNNKSNWFNFVEGDRIREVWFAEDALLLRDESTRICFARTKNGYQFQGIYVPEKIGDEMIEGKSERVRTFRRISKTYSN